MTYEQLSSQTHISQHEFYQGVIATGPILLGIIPFGITCGIMGLTAGLTQLETVLMSLLVLPVPASL